MTLTLKSLSRQKDTLHTDDGMLLIYISNLFIHLYINTIRHTSAYHTHRHLKPKLVL